MARSFTRKPVPRRCSGKDHPYLRLDPDANSVLLRDLDPCRDYSFYMVSIDAAGRISEPSPTTPAVHATAGGSLPPPTNVRVRLWTTNDYTYEYSDGLDSRTVIRLKWDYACNPSADFAVEQSLNLIDWTGGQGHPINRGDLGFEKTMFMLPLPVPVGTTIYYRVKAKVDGVDSPPSAAVAAVILPYESSRPSPPSNLVARYIAGGQIKLFWCPNPISHGRSGHRLPDLPGHDFWAAVRFCGFCLAG